MNGLGRNKEENDNKSLVFTKETLGVVLLLFATLCLVCLITRDSIFSMLGLYVNSFLFGCFGVFAYAVDLYFIGLGVLLISGKNTGLSKKRKSLITLLFLVVALISHIATISANGYAYGEYVSASYHMGDGGVQTTSAGGLFTALLAYVFSALLTDVGSYVILGIVAAALGYAIVKDWINGTPVAKSAKEKFKSSHVREDNLDIGVEISGTKDYPVEGVDFVAPTGKQKLFINNPSDFAVKSKREMHKEQNNPNGMKFGFVDGGLGVVSTPTQANNISASDDIKRKLDYIKTPAVIDMNKFNSNSDVNSGNPYLKGNNGGTTNVSGYVNPRTVEEPKTANQNTEIPFIDHETPSASPQVSAPIDSAEAHAELFNKYLGVEETPTFNGMMVEKNEEVFHKIDVEPSNQPVEEEKYKDIPFIDETEEENESAADRADAFAQLFNEDFNRNEDKEATAPQMEVEQPKIEQEEPPTPSVTSSRRIRDIFSSSEKEEVEKPTEPLGFTSRAVADNNGGVRRGLAFNQPPQEQVPEQKIEKPAPPINREYFRPPFDLLETYSQPVNAGQEDHQERMEIIQRTLEEFHINAVPQSYIQGPSVTRYEIMMPAGISVRKVLAYDDDLKMRLAAKDGVRIEAPIPGKNLVGIEVANSVKVTVGLKEVMEGLAGKKTKPTALMFAVGKDIVGNSISYDLAKGPHYLIAGATGSGKSVALHVMIVSLLMRYSPEELKLVLVDPKSVEFRKYEHIPHLLVDEIVTEPKRALTLLQWAYDETNRRNEMFTSCGGMVSNIDDYNTQIASDTIPKLPRIVFVIDELADLMEACKKDLEQRIRMIAAKSRSAGIHLVLATQRPSVDVITGTIKANLPSRIALKVMNFADSQTILGEAGAEKLLGNGDMLYKDSSMGDYERYQGAYISGREVTNIVNYIKEHNKAYFDDDVQEFLDNETKPKVDESAAADVGENGGEEFDSLFIKALWLAVNSQSVSISQLQRRFQIGYARAGGLVDKMERHGFVSGNEGSKARRVLLTKEEFEQRFGPVDEAY